MGCQDPKEVAMQKQNAQSPRDKAEAIGLRKGRRKLRSRGLFIGQEVAGRHSRDNKEGVESLSSETCSSTRGLQGTRMPPGNNLGLGPIKHSKWRRLAHRCVVFQLQKAISLLTQTSYSRCQVRAQPKNWLGH